MKAGLASYFDLGRSFGLTDHAFQSTRLSPEADISLVGIKNPLGRGVTVDIAQTAPELLSAWRHEAVEQVRRPEMETGWQSEWADLSRSDFDSQLAELITRHRIDTCAMTIYPLGVAYVRFELASGIDLRFLLGILACYEYAAYRPQVAALFARHAETHAKASRAGSADTLSRLTRRPAAEIQEDASGYEESNLFRSFTHLVRCVDGDSADDVRRLREILGLTGEPMKFEYHGQLHYGWADCVLEPRGEPPWTPDQDLARIEECIRIAHVGLGTCEAFQRLFQDEINTQVESLLKKRHAGRDSRDLNRLRTLALAVVNLTDFRRITQADEDQKYFQQFAADAGLDRTQQLITNAVDVLYNVQDAEAQDERARRESLLNGIVVLLASLTLVSVTVDAYNFIEMDEPLIDERLQRVRLLSEFVLALTLVVVILVWMLIRPRRGRGS
jgi:hypothetical protein